MLNSRDKMLQNMLIGDYRKYVDIINMELVDIILEKINNGVELENGAVRKYDILDYYLENKIIFRKLYEFVKNEAQRENINVEEQKKLLDKAKKLLEFMNKSPIGLTQLTDIVKKDILNVNDTYVIKDYNGEPIPGLKQTITREEKQQIFDYMNDNNLPLFYNIYLLVLNRYLTKELKFENNISKKI